MDGDRFLAPVAEHEWHDVVIHFKASAVDAGFYETFLDGNLIDSRSGVSMIADGADTPTSRTASTATATTAPRHLRTRASTPPSSAHSMSDVVAG